MTTDLTRCPRCHAPLPVRVSNAGLCPLCLVNSALSLSSEELDTGVEPPYQTITVLARGSSSLTYLATPVGTRRHVALKIVRCGNAGDVIRRFERWRNLVAFERYPGVARLIDAGPAPDKSVYVASEYVPGASLETMLQQDRLDVGARRAVVAQVSASLAAMRDKGVAHMRVTPARIRIAFAETVRATLIGFGMALILDGVSPDPGVDAAALSDLAVRLEAQP